MNTSSIVQKIWNYCNVLGDDGMSYDDYVEQLTYLLFLKMADERTQAPYHQPSIASQQYSWSSLIKKDGDEPFDHYRHALDALVKVKGLLGLIFNNAQNKLQDPAKLRSLLVDLIDKENWSVMSADVKSYSYEGLLEKNAQDTKSSAAQYFTPRPLIQVMVDAVTSEPGETVADPGERFDLLLGSPPFGKKSSTRFVGEIESQDDTSLKRAERLCQSILGLAFAGDLASSPMQAGS